MDSISYHTRNFHHFLKETLQKHTDDYNWAVNKCKILNAEMDKIPMTYVNKRQEKAEEITNVVNQITIFERLKKQAEDELKEYEDKHKTSTRDKKYKRPPSLAQKRAWAKGAGRASGKARRKKGLL